MKKCMVTDPKQEKLLDFDAMYSNCFSAVDA